MYLKHSSFFSVESYFKKIFFTIFIMNSLLAIVISYHIKKQHDKKMKRLRLKQL